MKREGISMASNFKILIHRNSDNLHFKLVGDFDGNSAHQLLNLLDKNSLVASKIFIHTSCVGSIAPFGRSVFRDNIHLLKGKPAHLLFTGERASELSS